MLMLVLVTVLLPLRLQSGLIVALLLKLPPTNNGKRAQILIYPHGSIYFNINNLFFKLYTSAICIYPKCPHKYFFASFDVILPFLI